MKLNIMALRGFIASLTLFVLGLGNFAFSNKLIVEDTIVFTYDVIHSRPLKAESFFKKGKYKAPKNGEIQSHLKKILDDPERFDMDTSLSKVNTEKRYDFSLYTLTDAGSISLFGNKFYYLFYTDFNDDRSERITFTTLYHLNPTTHELIHIPIGFQAATTPLCFGDFNEDGLLDYAEWAYGTRLTMYSIIESKLVKDPDHWIATDMLNFEEYFIVPDKTVWFKKF